MKGMELKSPFTALFQQMRKAFTSLWLPWTIAGITLLAVLVIEGLQLPWVASLSGAGRVLFWFVVLLGLGLVYLTITRFIELYEQRHRLEKRLVEAEKRVTDAYQRLETIFHVSQTFVDASDEEEVITPVLRLLVDLTGADGASFVPIDEHGQPQAAISHGDLPFPVMEAWVEYLASPGVRGRCRVCATPEAPDKPQTCPLLKNPFSDAVKLYCLSVRRGEREFGVVTLFSSALLFTSASGFDEPSDESLRIYLRALIDETALGLEGLYLRRRELNALRQMQSLRQKTDLKGLLNGLLENVYHALEADFAELVVPGSHTTHSAESENSGAPSTAFDLLQGDVPVAARPFLNGIVQGVMVSGELAVLGDVSGEMGFRSLIAAPLLSPAIENVSGRTVLGVILVGNHRSHSFHQRQVALLQTIAGQVALVVQNAHLIAELEYKTMMQERLRLAREIHDGLAQTLGFLKLQAAQMRNYLGRGDMDRLHSNVDLYYSTLTEAYQDARQSIDGLRISPAECGLQGWLEQTAHEFQDVSDLPVSLNIDDGLSERLEAADFPPEIHAQLIRIVQEALSNVRKHSQARRVWIDCALRNGDLVLEIRDDGIGYSPEDIALPSRHGLRGMRERADLIEADLQITSRPGEGTTVKISLPFNDGANSYPPAKNTTEVVK